MLHLLYILYLSQKSLFLSIILKRMNFSYNKTLLLLVPLLIMHVIRDKIAEVTLISGSLYQVIRKIMFIEGLQYLQ